MLIGKPEVQELFSHDELFFINDGAASNIDKAEPNVQERLVVCTRLDEIVDKTKTKTKPKTETQRAGERVARTCLVKAKQTLVKLQAIQERLSSFLLTSFGEVTKLLPTSYVLMISPRVVGKNDLGRAIARKH